MKKILLLAMLTMVCTIYHLDAGKKRNKSNPAPVEETIHDVDDDSVEITLRIEGTKLLNKGTHLLEQKKHAEAFKTIEEAVTYYRLPEACLLLATMYKDGTGCEKDIKMALSLVVAACEHGVLAIDLLRELVDKLTETDLVPEGPDNRPIPDGMYL